MRHASRPLSATVYKITNLLNGKFYIGVTTKALRLRLTQHFAAATQTKKNLNGAFQRAIRKYGRKAFVIEAMIECDSADVALSEEIRLIAELKPHYNSTKGGDGAAGVVFSSETRQKIGTASKGRTHRRGQKHSQETIERLRQLGHERAEIFAQYASMGPKASARAVICLDDGQQFESASAAAKHYGIAKSAVIEVCLRNPRRAQAGGRVFRYSDDIFDAKTELATAKRRTAEKTHAMRRARGQVI